MIESCFDSIMTFLMTTDVKVLSMRLWQKGKYG